MVALVEARRTGILAPFLPAPPMMTSQRSTRPSRVDKLDEAQALVVHLDAPGTGELVDGEAGGDGAMVAGRAPQRLQGLDPEAGAVLERAAIAVGAPVEMARQRVGRERRRRRHGYRGCRSRHRRPAAPLRRTSASTRRISSSLGLIGVDLGDAAGREAVEGSRHIARGEVVLDAAGAQLDAGQRAPSVHLVGHVAMIDDIALVPDGRAGRCRLIDLGMDRAGFGADAGPAALRLHRAMGGIGAGLRARRRRCIAAPGRSGSSASSARCGSARTAGRGGDRAA